MDRRHFSDRGKTDEVGIETWRVGQVKRGLYPASVVTLKKSIHHKLPLKCFSDANQLL